MNNTDVSRLTNSVIEEVGCDNFSTNETEVEYLIRCLRMRSWRKGEAKLILVGLYTDYHAMIDFCYEMRYAFLPGASDIKNSSCNYSYGDALESALAEVSDFINSSDKSLSPYHWIKLAADNNHAPPWLAIIRQSKTLYQLIVEARDFKVDMSLEFDHTHERRKAAEELHKLTPQNKAQILILKAYLKLSPATYEEWRKFKTWAEDKFADSKKPMCAYKTIANWFTALRAYQCGKFNERSKWIDEKKNEAINTPFPPGMELPFSPGDAEGKAN